MAQGMTVIRPLQRPVPLRQSVYDALIDLIVGGELPPGQHMVETDLARQLGVSRQPIREALHRMEAEGWVDLRPSQGAFVHVPTDQEVDELLDVRALLEAETARLAARAASPEQVARLREICAEGQAAADAGDLSRAVAVNDTFHAEIAAAAGNSVLAELADIVGRRVQWYYRMVAPERGHGSWPEHAELIDAIEASDADRAQLLARKHTERTRDAYHHALSAAQGRRTTLTGSGAYGSFALSMSSISPRSDRMWYDPSARYSRMIVCVPSACRYRSSV
jgi:DNA-binding GntR family transcriptional regulator